jgi:orotate phosphoribosyltransferase
MPLIGRLFIAKMAERGWKPDAVGGLTMGADPIVIAVARQTIEQPPLINAFLVRKEPKGHGMKRQIEGLGDEAAGAAVVIVDDVCTTGDSTVKAIEASREAGLRVLGAICLVDRDEGAKERIEGLGCPFERIFSLSEL